MKTFILFLLGSSSLPSDAFVRTFGVSFSSRASLTSWGSKMNDEVVGTTTTRNYRAQFNTTLAFPSYEELIALGPGGYVESDPITVTTIDGTMA